MFTIFHLFRILGLLSGCVFGIRFGFEFYGWRGAIIGSLLGALIGIFIGNLPFFVGTWYLWINLKLSDSSKLKNRLETDFFISHLIIAELVIRGEDTEQFKDYVLNLLQSEYSNQRRFGWHNLNIWFPELAKNLEYYDSENPTDEHKSKILEFRNGKHLENNQT